jgi:hypothetical protein
LRRSRFKASLGKEFARPLPPTTFKVTRAKWTEGVAQVPALQVQSPEFKPRPQKELGGGPGVWLK